ncbi:MAG TPA: hypothetical protein VFQ78_08195 [Candidatus Udaeobacter sp.]|jgi:hypothetical protein|nr:hypothetical protein [Candidatus Udaeobacter sp.]
MKRLPRNVTPLRVDGWPVDTLDQTTMAEFRKLADQNNWTIARVMHEVTQKYLARLKAEQELDGKIIQFPIPNTDSRPSVAQESSRA